MAEKQQSTDPSSPLVVKVGGSLISHIPDLVPLFCRSNRPVFIVPGGSIFADTVRRTTLNDTPAHWMAVAAMDQYGWYIASHGIGVTQNLKIPEKSVVFLPYCVLCGQDPLPHRWSVTSDSVAAWIADVLGLDLLILKSVDGIMKKNNILLVSVNGPVDTETVDPFLIPFILEKKIRTTVINGSHITCVEKFLLGDQVLGTKIGTTF
jgi:5-(aminomethyl)-3-furanmethanol phosphate kinase